MEKEKRKYNRRKSFISTGKITPIIPKKFTSALGCKIINISPKGISFYSDLDLGIGQLVRIGVNGNNNVYCVKWKEEINDLDNGKYRYGLELFGQSFENYTVT